MRRTWIGAAGAAVMAAGLATAAPSAQAQPTSGGWRLSFAGYSDGLNVLRLTVDYRFSSAGYGISMVGRTNGLVGLFYHANWSTISVGRWTPAGIAPSRYVSDGTFGGKYRHVELAFDGEGPEIRQLIPPDDGDHEPMPPGADAGAVDSLGAMALFVRLAGREGGCTGRLKTFDGRKVDDVVLHPQPNAMLSASDRSGWHGVAEHCTFVTQTIAGFDRRDASAGRRPHTEDMWLGPPAPGAPALPVRMTLYTYRLGNILLTLTDAVPLDDTGKPVR